MTFIGAFAAAQTPDPVEPLVTTVQVTASIQAEAPVNATALNRAALESLPGVNLDDRLRIVPGFSLFRRSSSLVANPTTQGVSLRGIGSTGASRTLILWDGLPLNDPFGGWIYWTRVAPEEIDRVEVTRGAALSAFGDRALGGSISLFSRNPEPGLHLRGGIEGGNLGTLLLNTAASYQRGRWAASTVFRGGTTDGYFLVPPSSRGAVDQPANVEYAAGLFRIDYAATRDKLFARFDVLAEQRANGTALQENSTGLGGLGVNYSRDFGSSQFSALAFHQREQFHASFTAIAANRASERLTARQTVPASASGYAAFFQGRSRQLLYLAGADLNRAEGASREQLFPSGSRLGQGALLQHGYFGQASLRTRAWTLHAGARPQFLSGGRFFFAPNGGLTFARRSWRARLSGYRAFRAPTLNELYREFRVGNAITRANPNLDVESLTAVEAGFDLALERDRFSLTAFRNDLSNLITNVTLSTGATIVRERRNAASALSQGLEAEWRRTWARPRAVTLSSELSYLFAESRFGSGERLPQVPKHQGSAQLTAAWKSGVAAAALRSYASQFEDDLNRFRLPGFAVLQFTARQRLYARLAATFALENALDRECAVGFSPTPLVGNPRLWRAGLRWN